MFHKLLQSSVNLVPWSLRTRIKDLPVIARLQRWFFNKALAGRSFVHVINRGPAQGLAYPVSLPQDKSIWAGTYEAPFASALQEVVRKGDVCYDIGGFRGFMGGVCARAGAGLVVIFEPFPANCAQIQRMADLNPTLPIRLESIAVGDRDGEVEFSVMPENSMGKLAASPFQPGATPTAHIRVMMRRLDSFVGQAELPPPNVMKIDVEGAELLVLRGALQVLRQHHPRLLIEAHSRDLVRECVALLESVGYRITILKGPTDSTANNQSEIAHLSAQAMNPAIR